MLHTLVTLGLWSATFVLGFVTIVTYLASIHPTHCSSLLGDDSDLQQCPLQISNLSNFVSANSHKLQSLHIALFRIVTFLAPIVLVPRLRLNLWQSLREGMAVQALDAGNRFSQSAGVGSAFWLIWVTSRPKGLACFVLLVGAASFASTFASGAIFASRTGPYTVTTQFTNGGSLGLPFNPTIFEPNVAIAGGVVNARMILTSDTIANRTWNTTTSSVHVIPWMMDSDIARIREAKFPASSRTLALYSSVDCSPTAYDRVGGGPDILSLPNESWKSLILPATIGGQLAGNFHMDPVMSMSYLNVTTGIGPGWVEATSSLVFTRANGSIEGAQFHLNAPAGSTVLYNGVDVAVCTSTARLAMSSCFLNRPGSKSAGYITSCSPLSAEDLPPSANNQYGGLDAILERADNLDSYAAYASAAPVWLTQTTGDRIPAVNFLDQAIDARVIPKPFLTQGAGHHDSLLVPSAYLSEVVIPTAQHAFVQGILFGVQNHNTPQSATLIANFATSQPWLQFLVFGTAVSIALFASIASISPASRRSADLELARLISISRHPDLGPVFAGWEGDEGEVKGKVLEVKLQYGQAQGTGCLLLKDHEGVDSVALLRRGVPASETPIWDLKLHRVNGVTSKRDSKMSNLNPCNRVARRGL